MKLVALIVLLILAIACSAEPAPTAATTNPYGSFHRGSVFSFPDLESKLMAARFAPYQVFPLAWYELPDEGYCFRLMHVHSPQSSAPTSRGIVLELRGHRGLPALLLAEIDHTGVKWTTRIVPAAAADEMLRMVEQAGLLAPPSLERPRSISAYNFSLEVRVGRRYQFIWRQAPADDTVKRSLEGFLAVVQRFVELAEVPSSEVFYGKSQR